MRWYHYIWHKSLRRPYKLARTIDSGEGKTILLIHGLGGSGHVWSPLVNQLNKNKWRAVGFDLLGFGISPKPSWSNYSVQEHAAAILASLARAEKKDQLTIVAHSMGSLVASHIATIRPDLVDRMILYEPPLFADDPEYRSHKRRKILYFAIYRSIAKRPQLVITFSRVAAKFANAVYKFTVDRDTWTAFDRSLHNTIMAQKAYDELKAINVPTDIIHGRLDFVVTRTDVKKMLMINPNINYHTVSEMHGVSKKAVKYIIRLLNKPHKPEVKPIS